MRFRGKNNFGAPTAGVAFAGAAIPEESATLFLHDWFLMDAILRLAAGDRRGRSCVNVKFKANNGAADAVGVKAVPVVL